MELLKTEIDGVKYILTMDTSFVFCNEFSLFKVLDNRRSIELLHCVAYEEIVTYMENRTKEISGVEWSKVRDY